jgi:hypothetical protein
MVKLVIKTLSDQQTEIDGLSVCSKSELKQENGRDEIQKFVHIDVGYVDISRLSDWNKDCENELKSLQESPELLRCVLATTGSIWVNSAGA